MNIYQEIIHKTRYARFVEAENRRENWNESVDRYINFHKERLPNIKIPWEKLRNAILNMEIMPAMRQLQTAGKALEEDEVAGYNCWGLVVDHPRVFDEALYILMCGGGVGFSVERQFIAKLPEVAEELHRTDTVIKVHDSKIGWAKALKELISLLYAGQIPQWDLSSIRPEGARLRTFGGRASGPAPLESLFRFTVKTFKDAAGRKLNSLECHDIMCMVGECVVSGGVRRSALLSLSNLTDTRMAGAKVGNYPSYRRLANNSVCYTESPDTNILLKELVNLYESKSGERGIFNREAAIRHVKQIGRREYEGWYFICNPCSEIILRPNQACNLSEVIIRPHDTLDDLLRKVELATILGTIQSTLTDFKYIRKIYQRNCEDERLLGVSLTGIMDHPIMSGGVYFKKYISDHYFDTLVKQYGNVEFDEILEQLKQKAIETNGKYSKRLNINSAAAITCVKPSGTVSQLVNCSSGIHPRFSRFWIRRIINANTDPITQFLKDAGVPNEPDLNNPSNTVFSFPMQAPEDVVTEKEFNGVQQLELWKIYNTHWCEHKPSMSCYYNDENFFDIMAWVKRNFNDISGISFFPKDDNLYQQAPYEEITKEQYEEMASRMPSIDWDTFKESEDITDMKTELACSAKGGCEV